jgi:ribosome-associated protein
MSNDVFVQEGITIPEHELEITTSKSGGAGGQHVNKTESKITVRWNVKTSNAITHEQKMRIIENWGGRLTEEGDFIIHSSESRSQQHNKMAALKRLEKEIKKALYVPKKRMKTRVSKSAKEARLQSKKIRSSVKKLRKVHFDE